MSVAPAHVTLADMERTANVMAPISTAKTMMQLVECNILIHITCLFMK